MIVGTGYTQCMTYTYTSMLGIDTYTIHVQQTYTHIYAYIHTHTLTLKHNICGVYRSHCGTTSIYWNKFKNY